MTKKIIVKGAKTHNLKNINIEIPRDKLTVITGLSGSGKSSLAFDTLYAEGQRRYVESLSAYARQFLSMMNKPEVDSIEGLSPAISIEQKTTSHNPRSTVGTVTEIYDYLRVLYARVGEAICPEHKIALKAQTVTQMVQQTLALPENEKMMILAPIIFEKKGTHINLISKMFAQGFIRAKINGEICDLDNPPEFKKQNKHTIEVVVDRFKVNSKHKQRLVESFETAINLTSGIVKLHYMDKHTEDIILSSKHACPKCNFSLKEISPRLFSFNNPSGACASCDGLGQKAYFSQEKLIKNKELSLSQGAIPSWEPKNKWLYCQLEALAKHYKFSLDTKFNKLPIKIIDIIFNGSKDENINIIYNNLKGLNYEKNKPFEGVINYLSRRFLETESDIIRDELSKMMSRSICPDCDGKRLNLSARNVFINKMNIGDLTSLSIEKTYDWIKNISLIGQNKIIAKGLLKEIQDRLGFLVNVGLNYLSLSRESGTLSGGEAQRIRLASQIGAGLVGVMYILDEPSIGLHQRDNQKLLDTLIHLRDIGNTVIVVEHDEEAIRQADYVIDIGPYAGIHGGEIVACGAPEVVLKNKKSLTADYLSGRKKIDIPRKRLKYNKKNVLEIIGMKGNNLKNIDLKIPLGLLTCVTGVSGSGKSTMINKTLYPLIAKVLNNNNSLQVSEYKSYKGFEKIDKVIDINQNAIGRTPRSNPATYTGVFTAIRELFAQTEESKVRGYSPGRFSFNVKGGRCESCRGDGLIKVEMHFLADVFVPCDNCLSKRYNMETLEILYKNKNINDVLNMSVEEACEFFNAIPTIKNKLATLLNVGLSYITLGQNATTLSGGEAQRIKLAKELSKRATGNTLYILDEPTTGLHFHDIKVLLSVLNELKNQGNTLVIIEHNLDVIKTADWIIDIGPEGGDGGGEILIENTPEKVALAENSYTGRYLKKILS